MITFKSPANPKSIWKLCFKNSKEMNDIFYEDAEPEEGQTLFGLTDYLALKVYINEDLDGFLLKKTIRHELMHIYLWENEKKNSLYNDDEICEIMCIAAPLICNKTDEIISKIKKERRRKYEKLTK